MQNIDTITRSLEENLLQDVINQDTPLMTEGVDSFDDLNSQNSRIKSFNDRITAIASLLYLKESTIQTVRRDDAIAGSIFFNQDTNCIEYFDGQAWRSNIFGPNTILDTKSFSVAELRNGNPEDPSGVTVANISYLTTKMEVAADNILFIVVDGDLLDRTRYTVDDKDRKKIIFTIPVSVYNNISYFVLGSSDNFSGSIPRYETVEFQGDGSRTVFNISNNEEFLATYKSSVEVYVDGIKVRDSEFSLGTSRNFIILREAPKVDSIVEIKTLYGVATDFRGSLLNIEQVEEAKINEQQTFKFNGVSDAVKVYLDGVRLVVNKDFKFNYVEKLVILSDERKKSVKIGSTVVIEKELIPLSKVPMQGVMITETKTITDQQIQLSNKCNGITSVLVYTGDGNDKKELLAGEYFVNDGILSFKDAGVNSKLCQVIYLSNSEIPDSDIPTIDDNDSASVNKTWSARAITQALNKKADSAGNTYQDFVMANGTVSSALTVGGNAHVGSDLNVTRSITGSSLQIGPSSGYHFEVNTDRSEINGRFNAIFTKDVTVEGNLTVNGTYSGKMQEVTTYKNSILELNSGLTTANEPVATSGLLINRGKNGKSSLKFVESTGKWTVYPTDGSEEGKLEISLSDHKHDIGVFSGDFIPRAKGLFSYKDTTDNFYEKTAIEPFLKGQTAQNNQNKDKMVSRLQIRNSNINDSEAIADINSGTILSYQMHVAHNNNGNPQYERIDAFNVIEDGSIICDSKGALALPQGGDAGRWASGRDGFKSNLESLAGENFVNRNGIIRYNTDQKCIEVKIDGTWCKFYKPDVNPSRSSECSFTRGRYIKEFGIEDFVSLQPNEISGNFGFVVGEKVIKVQHNLGTNYVSCTIFDDKRTPFPLIYKCVDQNTIYISFPSNIEEMSGSVEIAEWMKYLASSLHRNNTTEGAGHGGVVQTAKPLNPAKKYILFVNEL